VQRNEGETGTVLLLTGNDADKCTGFPAGQGANYENGTNWYRHLLRMPAFWEGEEER
jgi:hypothetical protein